MFCGAPWSTKHFRILKTHGQSPLGFKVSSCSVYFVIYLLKLATNGTDAAIGTLNKQV